MFNIHTSAVWLLILLTSADKNLVAKDYLGEERGRRLSIRAAVIQSYFWEDEGDVGILCHSKHI